MVFNTTFYGMYNELVEISQYMTNEEFLTGFGLVQGLPGPMFSFSAYAGGMAARGILMRNSGINIENIIVMLLTVTLLLSKKVPAPVIVLLTITAGFIIG